jgi:type IV pilus assembly protein PilC
MSLNDWLSQRARVSSRRHSRIGIDDKMMFFQQLASLVSSGTPLLQSIQIVSQQNASTKLARVLNDVAGQVAAGSSLQVAMEEYPDIFESHWIALVGTGEVSRKLDNVLCDLNNQIRESRETMRQFTGALVCPVILLFVAILVIVTMLWFVVPTFADMFSEMNAELPAITQFVIDISHAIANYAPHGTVAIVLLVIVGGKYLRTEEGLRRISALGLAVPMLGELMVQSAMYRFASNLGLLLKSGVPMLDTLETLSTVFRKNPVYQDAVMQAQYRVAAGRSLAESLEESGLFTSMMTDTIHIGEQSAQLDVVMEQLAPYYKEKMNSFLAKITKLLEPTIIMFMGVTIAVIMLAIYIPMFEMSGKVQ